MTRTMFDGVTVSSVPKGGDLYAYYINGTYANGPEVKARFPGKRYVAITVTASHPAAKGMVLDCETGDATVSQAVAWVAAYPGNNQEVTVYCNSSTWPSVRSAFRSAKVAEPSYWVAQYDNVREIPAGAVAKQYRGDVSPGFDESVVVDYWPGVDPVPVSTPSLEGDDVLVIISPDDKALPKGVKWPGDFLLTGGRLVHLTSPADEAAFKAAGVKVVNVSYAQYVALGGK